MFQAPSVLLSDLASEGRVRESFSFRLRFTAYELKSFQPISRFGFGFWCAKAFDAQFVNPVDLLNLGS